MVINLRRPGKRRADETGCVWSVSGNARDHKLGSRYLCIFNGKDVTKDTFYVDSRRGIVRMFKTDNDGRHYIDRTTGDPAMEERRGHVRLRRKAAA